MILQLQFLRFLAFLWVFLTHFHKWMPQRLPDYGGLMSLSFFFLLSGFLTGYGYAKVDLGPGWARRTGRYLLSKVAKFYPLLALPLLFSCFYYHCGLQTALAMPHRWASDVWTFLSTALLLQAWLPKGHYGCVTVAWFLSALMFLYVFRLPMLWLIGRLKRSKVALALGFILPFALLTVYSYVGYAAKLDPEYWLRIFPPVHLAEFFSAMILGELCFDWHACGHPSSPTNIWLMTTVEILAFGFWLAFPFLPLPRPTWDYQIVRWILPNLVLLVAFSLSDGYLVRALRHRFFITLGAFALPGYLLHMMVHYMLGTCFNAWLEPSWLTLSLAFALTMIVSSFYLHDTDGCRRLMDYPKKLALALALFVYVLPALVTGFCQYHPGQMLEVRFAARDVAQVRRISYMDAYYSTETDRRLNEYKKIRSVKVNPNGVSVLVPHDIWDFRLDFHVVGGGDCSSAVPDLSEATLGGERLDVQRFRRFAWDQMRTCGYLYRKPDGESK